MREAVNKRHSSEFLLREAPPIGEHLLFPDTGERVASRKPTILESSGKKSEESSGSRNGRVASPKEQDHQTSGDFLDRFVRDELGFNREARGHVNNIIQLGRIQNYCDRLAIDKRHSELCAMIPSERDMGELEHLKSALGERHLVWAKTVSHDLGGKLKANIVGREEKIREEIAKLWLQEGNELDGRDIDNLFILAAAIGHGNPVSFKNLLEFQTTPGKFRGPTLNMHSIVGVDAVTDVLKDAFHEEIRSTQAKERAQKLLWSEWKTPLWIDTPDKNVDDALNGKDNKNKDFEPAFLHLVAYAARKIGFDKATVRIARGNSVLDATVMLDLG